MVTFSNAIALWVKHLMQSYDWSIKILLEIIYTLLL